MLGAAPVVETVSDTSDTEPVKRPTRVRKPRISTEELAVVDVPRVPTKKLEIDTTDMSKLMRQIIVQTTTLSAGDVVEVPTTVNPILATNACYTPKSSSVIALGENTTARDQVVFQ